MDDDSLLDKALETRREQQRVPGKAASEATMPCPPDPTLDKLFKDFAARMNGRNAVSFVRPEFYTEQTIRKTGSFLSRRTEPVTQGRTRIHEVARGWTIGIGRKIKLKEEEEHGWHFSPAQYGWHSLGVTTEGLPWFVVVDEQADLIIGSGEFSRPTAAYVGPPLGPSLRATVIEVLQINPIHIPGVKTQHYIPNPNSAGWRQALTNGHEELPAYIADAMARVLSSDK